MTLMKHARGFTLIELIIVLVIGGILVAIGVPNLSVFLKNSARTTRLNDMVTALNYARSEAVKRNTAVGVCATVDFANCIPDSTDASFSTGWLVRQLPRVTPPPALPQVVLRTFEQNLTGVTAITGSFSELVYQGNGISATGRATFKYCDDRGATAARAVLVSNTGHPGISRDTDGDGTHEDVAGNELVCP